jgi:hypothetical protein
MTCYVTLVFNGKRKSTKLNQKRLIEELKINIKRSKLIENAICIRRK